MGDGEGPNIHYRCCSLAKVCATLCDPVDCSPPGFPVLCCLLEFAQSHVHGGSDTTQLSPPLSTPSLALNLPQHLSLLLSFDTAYKTENYRQPIIQHRGLSSPLCSGVTQWEGNLKKKVDIWIWVTYSL